MKSKLKKILCIMLLIIILTSSILVPKVNAFNGVSAGDMTGGIPFITDGITNLINGQDWISAWENAGGNQYDRDKQNGTFGSWIVDSFTGNPDAEKSTFSKRDPLDTLVAGTAGILLTPAKVICLAIGNISQTFAGRVASVGAGSGQGDVFLCMEDVLFHNVSGNKRIPLIDVNFFEDKGGSEVQGIRTGVKEWYYAIRNLAIILSLIVLIYVGIRMATSTLADDKVKYKKLFVDWLVGFVILFLLHYIIVGVVVINEKLIGSIYSSNLTSGLFENYTGKIYLEALNPTTFVNSWSATIVFLFLTVLTLMFLFSYIKRMLTVAFLIIISPIITVTYSIDRMGDGKSQALNTWLKEFAYNILIQPFHCIIFLVFADLLKTLLQDGSDLGKGVVVICIMLFIKQCEGIVRQIFGFANKTGLTNSFASAVLLGESMKIAKKSAEDLTKAAGSAKEAKNKAANTRRPALKNTNNVQDGSSRNGAANASNTQTRSSGATAPMPQAEPTQSYSQQTSGERQAPTATPMPAGATDSGMPPVRQYNTAKTQKEAEKFQKALSAIIKANETALDIGFGIAVGGAIGNGPTDMITAGGFAKAGRNVTKMLGGKGVSGAKTLAGRFKKGSRVNNKRNSVQEAYNELKAERGWDDDRMLDETERLLGVDTNNLPEGSVKKYAQSVQSYREEFVEEYVEPDDMVLYNVSQMGSHTRTQTSEPEPEPEPAPTRRNNRRNSSGSRETGKRGKKGRRGTVPLDRPDVRPPESTSQPKQKKGSNSTYQNRGRGSGRRNNRRK